MRFNEILINSFYKIQKERYWKHVKQKNSENDRLSPMRERFLLKGSTMGSHATQYLEDNRKLCAPHFVMYGLLINQGEYVH